MVSLRIASPCSASWEGMRVVAGGRHCEACDKQVHDFTRMTETEAVARALLFGGTGLCGRILVDAEGNTRFRPQAHRRRMRARALPVVAAAAAFGAGCAAHEPAAPPLPASASPQPSADVAACEPAAKIVEHGAPSATPGSDAAASPVIRRIVTTSGGMHVLRQVTFRPGDATLDADDEPLLEEVAKLLLQMPDIRKVLVKGHTDKLEQRPDKLSRDRADIVISFLVSRGVQAARLEPRGLGAEQPMDDPTTPEGRARNRRVEFQIVPDP